MNRMRNGALCKNPTCHVSEFTRTSLTWCRYVADLTPDFILALAATASYLQAPIIRDAICKHVSFRPSIRVNVPVS
jgi:hypothetical protein